MPEEQVAAMTPEARIARVKAELWSDEAQALGVFAVLDAARDARIHPAVLGCRLEHACLYAGKLPQEMLEVAPYLVALKKDAPFTDALLRDGWGQSWGIFLGSTGTLEELRRHFRRFLQVQDEAGETMIFRFYDPRVFRVYLPTCNTGELATVFGPVGLYWMEGEAGEVIRFHRDGEGLEKHLG